MNRIKERELEKIRGELKEVCQTFLNVYNAAAEADGVWAEEENSTDDWLWERIGVLERRLDRLAPGCGPKYDRSACEEANICVIGEWCGLRSSALHEVFDQQSPTPLWNSAGEPSRRDAAVVSD